jgi:hypothetical protein
LWSTVQQKYLSEHTVTALIVVPQSHMSLYEEIKTAIRRGKITSRQNSYDIPDLHSNNPQP